MFVSSNLIVHSRFRQAITSRRTKQAKDAPLSLIPLSKEEELAISNCEPRLFLSVSSRTSFNKGLKLKSAVLRNDVRPTWDNVGTLYFRGVAVLY